MREMFWFCYLLRFTMMFKCIVCMEMKRKRDEFKLENCKHSICFACASQHVEVQVSLGRRHIPCPWFGCGQSFLLKECKELLCGRSMNILENRMKESGIPVANRAYCTYDGCQGLMDSRKLAPGVAEVQCTSCSRFFKYTQTHVDEQVMEFASIMRWRQCLECGNMIELQDGCDHVICRCGAAFCYECGKPKSKQLIAGVIDDPWHTCN